MNKNPFSIYDFMGYLFPGVLCYVGLYYCASLDWNFKAIDFSSLSNVLELETADFDLQKSIVMIVLSYILGHMAAYLSSITIEFMANKIFGYPSEYLLTSDRLSYRELCRHYFECGADSSNKLLRWVKNVMRFILKVAVLALLLPISFTTFTFAYLTDLNGWIVRPLDSFLIKSILSKQYTLANRIGITHPDVNEKCDYHRIIQHYVFLNMPNSNKKTENYITLYGFLRSISFIFCCMFLILYLKALKTIDFEASIDWHIVIVLCTLYSVAYITFLGFMKFYRRFTLENYMSLLTGLPNDVNNSNNC